MQREQGISSTNTSLVDELYYDTNSLEVAKEKTIYKKVINIEEKRRKSRRYYFMRNRVTNKIGRAHV